MGLEIRVSVSRDYFELGFCAVTFSSQYFGTLAGKVVTSLSPLDKICALLEEIEDDVLPKLILLCHYETAINSGGVLYVIVCCLGNP